MFPIDLAPREGDQSTKIPRGYATPNVNLKTSPGSTPPTVSYSPKTDKPRRVQRTLTICLQNCTGNPSKKHMSRERMACISIHLAYIVHNPCIYYMRCWQDEDGEMNEPPLHIKKEKSIVLNIYNGSARIIPNESGRENDGVKPESQKEIMNSRAHPCSERCSTSSLSRIHSRSVSARVLCPYKNKRRNPEMHAEIAWLGSRLYRLRQFV